jgi:hypothetical protein
MRENHSVRNETPGDIHELEWKPYLAVPIPATITASAGGRRDRLSTSAFRLLQRPRVQKESVTTCSATASSFPISNEDEVICR